MSEPTSELWVRRIIALGCSLRIVEAGAAGTVKVSRTVRRIVLCAVRPDTRLTLRLRLLDHRLGSSVWIDLLSAGAGVLAAEWLLYICLTLGGIEIVPCTEKHMCFSGSCFPEVPLAANGCHRVDITVSCCFLKSA